MKLHSDVCTACVSLVLCARLFDLQTQCLGPRRGSFLCCQSSWQRPELLRGPLLSDLPWPPLDLLALGDSSSRLPAGLSVLPGLLLACGHSPEGQAAGGSRLLSLSRWRGRLAHRLLLNFTLTLRRPTRGLQPTRVPRPRRRPRLSSASPGCAMKAGSLAQPFLPAGAAPRLPRSLCWDPRPRRQARRWWWRGWIPVWSRDGAQSTPGASSRNTAAAQGRCFHRERPGPHRGPPRASTAAASGHRGP